MSNGNLYNVSSPAKYEMALLFSILDLERFLFAFASYKLTEDTIFVYYVWLDMYQWKIWLTLCS